MERKYFNSTFGKISYIERKGIIPIIFLHGLGGTGNSWSKLTQYIPEKYSLYLFDLLGHGRSDKPDINYSIDVQEKIIKEFVENIGLEHVVIMGNSYGGWISLRLSVDFNIPEFLILEDSAGINVTYGEVQNDLREKFIDSIVEGNKLNSRRVIESIVINNSNPKWKLKEDELKSISIKTLIIWGKNDKIIDPSYGKKFNSLIRNSYLIEIDDAGHVPHIMKPEAVSRAVLNFLNS